MKAWRSKKKLIAIALFFVGSLTITSLVDIGQSSALSGSQWKAGRIIDDFVFYKGNAMSVSSIQSFLDSKVPTCDTNGTQEYNGTGMTRAEWAEENNRPLPPYKCLKSYTQSIPNRAADSYCSGSVSDGTKKAAQIIYDVAKACNISPKALIVTLQKEQGLVTDDWPWPVQYQKAMGYGCPDTSGCDPDFAGFFNQVWYATRQFQRYKAQPQLFNYRGGKTSFIKYNPSSSCGGTNVYIENQATAGLYNYTPYQPNSAALNNLYGTGNSCSAYGNRNFWRLFNDWFGSTWVNPVKVTVVDGNTSESGGTARVKFTLVSQPSDNVTIPLTLTDTGEGSLGANSVTITPSNWNSPNSNQVTITGIDDALQDGDVAYILVTHTPSSDDPSYGNLTAKDIPNATIYNADNEPYVPLVGDWNRDGRDTISMRRGYTNLINNGFDGRSDFKFNYGSSGYNDGANNKVLFGDWNGDGRDELGFKVGNYYYLNTGLDNHTDIVYQYGKSTDTPLVGDWNGDGKDTISVRRGYTNFINNGFDGRTDFYYNYGAGTEIALGGDWDRNGKDTISLRSGYTNRINNQFNGSTDFTYNYGMASDVPLVGDWNRDGRDTISVRRNSTNYINNSFDGSTNFTFNYGQ